MNLIYFITSLFILESSGSPLNSHQDTRSLNKRLFNPFKLFSRIIKGSPIRNDVQISTIPGYNPQSFIFPLNTLNQSGRLGRTTSGSNNQQASKSSELEQLLASLKSPSSGSGTDTNSSPQASQASELEQLLASIKSSASGASTGTNSNQINPLNTPFSLNSILPTLNLNDKQTTSPNLSQITVNGKRVDPNKPPYSNLFDSMGNINPYTINSLFNSII